MKNHPLFSMDLDLNDAEHRELANIDIGYLHVYRIIMGKPQICGPQFTAEQLPNVDALREMFGGGDYEIKGRPPDNSGFCRVVRVSIDPNIYPPKIPGSHVPQPQMPGAGQSSGIMGFSADQLAMLRTLLAPQQQMAPQQNDQSVIVALIQSQSAAFGAMMQAFGQQSQQSMANMVQIVSTLQQQSPGAPSNPAAVLQVALDVIQKLRPQGDGASSPFNWDTVGTIIENVMQTFQAGRDAVQAVAAAGAPPVGANVPPPPVAPPAESVHNQAA